MRESLSLGYLGINVLLSTYLNPDSNVTLKCNNKCADYPWVESLASNFITSKFITFRLKYQHSMASISQVYISKVFYL